MFATVVFKIVNLAATLGYLLNIIGMFAGYNSDAADIVNGVFHLIFLVGLLYIEVDQNPVISRYVPFLFSFIGRGVFYIWLAWITFSLEIVSTIGTTFTFVVGVVYVLLFLLKNIQTPESMKFDETSINDVIFAEGSVFLPSSSNGKHAERRSTTAEEADYLPV